VGKLPIGCAGDVDQDLAAVEQMGDGFLDFRHRINRSDGNAQRPGGDERRGFDLRWEDQGDAGILGPVSSSFALCKL
jgi:hypothetical protein